MKPCRLAALLVLSACAHKNTAVAGAPTPSTPAASRPSAAAVNLPPIPLATGPLQIRVVYPSPNQLIQSRDSNFIFGSVGNGHALLTIDGAPVQVYPNGSFIAFLPLPARDHTSYDLMATLGADTARATQPIRLLPPVPVLGDTGALVVDSSSVAPFGRLALRDDEIVRVAVRAPANASVAWRGDSSAIVPLVNGASLPPTPHSGRWVWPRAGCGPPAPSWWRGAPIRSGSTCPPSPRRRRSPPGACSAPTRAASATPTG